MKIKCLECGRRVKAKTRKTKRCAECQHQRRIEINRKYNESHKEQRKQYFQSHKEHYRELWREWYKRNKEKRKEYRREYRIRNIEKIRERQRRRQPLRRLYNRLYAQKHPFRHTHDKTNDLTVENGRVKGAVWLESQTAKKSVRKNFWRLSYLQRTYEREIQQRYKAFSNAVCSCGNLEKGFFTYVNQNTRYCFECGGEFVIAFENDYYTITEVCCSFCGLVLPQTTP